MKIVVNTRLLRKDQMDGIGWFTFNTMQLIVRRHPEIEFHFLFDSGIEREFIFGDNVVAKSLFPPAKHALLNVAWFEWSVRRYLETVKPDLFLSPDGVLCLGWKGKQYGVIHDVNFRHLPKDLKWSNRTYYNYFFPRYAQRAARLATVSEYSKKDIVKTFGVPPDKIDVVYNGIHSFYGPVTEDVKQQVKVKYAQGSDYFIFVGTLHPRKNILRLMEAFQLFKQATGSNMKLILAGKEMYRTGEMHQLKASMKHGDDVIFTGRLSDDELKEVFASAFALAFVPYFEGFGIPVIEAMQCNVPVIAANATSLPEIAGDAALLVDPYDVNSISQAMIRLFHDPALASDLIKKGNARKLAFSWERTANLLWESVEKIL